MLHPIKVRSFGLLLAVGMTCARASGQDGPRAEYSSVPDNAFSTDHLASPGQLTAGVAHQIKIRSISSTTLRRWPLN